MNLQKLIGLRLKEEDPTEYMLKRDQYRELQDNKRMVEEEKANLQYNQQQEQVS